MYAAPVVGQRLWQSTLVRTGLREYIEWEHSHNKDDFLKERVTCVKLKKECNAS